MGRRLLLCINTTFLTEHRMEWRREDVEQASEILIRFQKRISPSTPRRPYNECVIDFGRIKCSLLSIEGFTAQWASLLGLSTRNFLSCLLWGLALRAA